MDIKVTECFKVSILVTRGCVTKIWGGRQKTPKKRKKGWKSISN